jgi:hypothetical protein
VSRGLSVSFTQAPLTLQASWGLFAVAGPDMKILTSAQTAFGFAAAFGTFLETGIAANFTGSTLITITPAAPIPDATLGLPFEVQFLASGGTGTGLVWTKTAGAAWGTINSSTGLFSGTPIAGPESDPFSIHVVDDGGNHGDLSF